MVMAMFIIFINFLDVKSAKYKLWKLFYILVKTSEKKSFIDNILFGTLMPKMLSKIGWVS